MYEIEAFDAPQETGLDVRSMAVGAEVAVAVLTPEQPEPFPTDPAALKDRLEQDRWKLFGSWVGAGLNGPDCAKKQLCQKFVDGSAALAVRRKRIQQLRDDIAANAAAGRAASADHSRTKEELRVLVEAAADQNLAARITGRAATFAGMDRYSVLEFEQKVAWVEIGISATRGANLQLELEGDEIEVLREEGHVWASIADVTQAMSYEMASEVTLFQNAVVLDVSAGHTGACRRRAKELLARWGEQSRARDQALRRISMANR